jgi:hypothetical protein
MKLWRAVWHDPDEGTCYVWTTTRREAKAKGAEIESQAEYGVEVQCIDIRPGREALVHWLNHNFTTDNG